MGRKAQNWNKLNNSKKTPLHELYDLIFCARSSVCDILFPIFHVFHCWITLHFEFVTNFSVLGAIYSREFTIDLKKTEIILVSETCFVIARITHQWLIRVSFQSDKHYWAPRFRRPNPKKCQIYKLHKCCLNRVPC